MSPPELNPDGSGQMFDGIAPRYDLLNRLLSFGLDQRWRRRLAECMPQGGRILDLATGTADVALALATASSDRRIVGLDPSTQMLEIGSQKITAQGLAAQIKLQEGDAQALPFEDNHFDGVCMAFGIRNVPDRDLALSEIRRVARPGAAIAILELSEPAGALGPLTRFHSRVITPLMGALLSRGAAYRYLKTSVEAFPSPDAFRDQMSAAGLEGAGAMRLSFGAAWLYIARA